MCNVLEHCSWFICEQTHGFKSEGTQIHLLPMPTLPLVQKNDLYIIYTTTTIGRRTRDCDRLAFLFLKLNQYIHWGEARPTVDWEGTFMHKCANIHNPLMGRQTTDPHNQFFVVVVERSQGEAGVKLHTSLVTPVTWDCLHLKIAHFKVSRTKRFQIERNQWCCYQCDWQESFQRITAIERERSTGAGQRRVESLQWWIELYCLRLSPFHRLTKGHDN